MGVAPLPGVAPGAGFGVKARQVPGTCRLQATAMVKPGEIFSHL